MRGSLAYAFLHSQAIGADDPQMGHQRTANVPLRARTQNSRPTWRGRRHPNPARGGHVAILHKRVVLLWRVTSHRAEVPEGGARVVEQGLGGPYCPPSSRLSRRAAARAPARSSSPTARLTMPTKRSISIRRFWTSVS